MTAKRGLFWYVDGELLCFPVSGAEVDTVGNNHRRFWKTLPHSLTGGMSYNYFPRGRESAGLSASYALHTGNLCPDSPCLFAAR